MKSIYFCFCLCVFLCSCDKGENAEEYHTSRFYFINNTNEYIEIKVYDHGNFAQSYLINPLDTLDNHFETVTVKGPVSGPGLGGDSVSIIYNSAKSITYTCGGSYKDNDCYKEGNIMLSGFFDIEPHPEENYTHFYYRFTEESFKSADNL